ncbi:MAG TPA: hypothetical protein DIT13_13630 [Verrucomicrobiales bacterium]|nr:hypothetical protein [Verrucomicrobiales bacterium]HRJ09067.1 hypothetical protein [Prosthecobacter sp.]HRK14162.1 hypothetical protein [Prosthecobacter sp.]
MKRELVCYHEGWFAEPAWLQRLLGWQDATLQTDAGQTRVVENSIIVCPDLGSLRPELLKRLGQASGVVLFHVSDEWFRSPLEVYRHFSHVIRSYHHTALELPGITQIPLGPCRDVRMGGKPRLSSERQFVWSFAGQVTATRSSMMECLRDMQPNSLRVTAGAPAAQTMLEPGAYRELLRESVFVPCPMGNVNLDSFRLYEALDAGALPIVERRPWLDYFTRLLGNHPLPSVTSWRHAAVLMRSFVRDKEALDRKQAEIQDWWERVQCRLGFKLAEVLQESCDSVSRPLAAAPLPGMMRSRWEMLMHHNRHALLARLQITVRRLFQRRPRSL